MRIYVVEGMNDYTTQIGWSTDKKVAEKKAAEFKKRTRQDAWVTCYTLKNDNWCSFNSD